MVDDLNKACEVLQKGGVILYPTDTIWGLGCDATSEDAVKRIYKIKRRSDSKSMLTLLDSPTRLVRYVDDLPEIAISLIEDSNKPLTIIYSGAKNLAPNLIASDGTVGIRITREAFSQKLCRQFGKPIVSTSANFSGEPAPANFSEINNEIFRLVDYVVNYRRDEMQKSKPSSIIRLDKDGVIKIIRE
ncbi:MAG: L-threonylcarbamoyladenylate synthase [Candidatus Azobacteroides sp.]|nr:L-threonylcarbamoyladenylate synthase [Candidatus Azobacteroides sp.]